MKNNFTLTILVTTMNDSIFHVQKKLLPQLQNADEIIISHQITDGMNYDSLVFSQKIKYFSMNEKWLSKNRNHAMRHATGDICYICDDDLELLPDFVQKIKNFYQKNDADVATFQAIDEKNNLIFRVKSGYHNVFSVLKIWSWGITFKREKILEKNIFFDEKFGLWAKYPVGEENIFLSECLKNNLQMKHCDNVIVRHSSESSGIDYRVELIEARVQVFKKIFGFFIAIISIFYFLILHFPLYHKKISVTKFLCISFKSLLYGK